MLAASPILERRLRREMEGDVLTRIFDRGRYATDASMYQITPAAVAVPRSMDAALAALAVAREEGVPVTPRGGGTSQSGQTVNSGLVIDTSKHLRQILHLDVTERRAVVEPGLVLDDLNRQLKPHGLWFPVDVSTASRATIGGMTANNSCGGRSLRYGTMRDNVLGIEAVLANGSEMRFGQVLAGRPGLANSLEQRLIDDLLSLGAREADEVKARFPKVQRRVGGYNLDALIPNAAGNNLAHVLVGSEGTLAFFKAVEIQLWPLMGRRVLGVCHFGSFHEAMDAAQHLVQLRPIAIELMDETMIGLGRDIAMFQPVIEVTVRGAPEALLLVEFAEEDAENAARLRQLSELMGDLGFGWDKPKSKWGGVVEVIEPQLQNALAEMRKAGLNIMMSMKEEGKPVSFVEDCAVPLEHLADYTARLTAIFAKHGTRGTWYAHASVGCLHVRPMLNLKLDKDVKAMRAIAEEAFAMVREYKGSHSGEHGDGIVRSEFHRAMFGERINGAFEEVKDRFDPAALMNPGKIVRAPKFDDRSLFRYNRDYGQADFRPQLDWSAFPGGAHGFQGAAEMCNNNGACRNLEGGAMCPSYRVTRDERDLTRGRANTLRLALSGQLGPNAITAGEMAETMKLCVSCKACRRECPAAVDMARMKIEVLAARAAKYGHSIGDRFVGWMPHYAPYAARVPWLLNLRDALPGMAKLSERIAGFSAQRTLPKWSGDAFRPAAAAEGPADGREVVLFADTFNRYFEPENLRDAVRVLTAAGYLVHHAHPKGGGRPLCCGRTFLAIGRVDKARHEMSRTLDALEPFVQRGAKIVGLEPSCLLSFRDELQAILPGERAQSFGKAALLFEEFIAGEAEAGHFKAPFLPQNRQALLHGHCHQKAFGAMPAVEAALKLVPGLDVKTVESSCCGMAGAFGYQADTIEISKAMGELSLLPAVRDASPGTVIIADGTSCRHQIADGANREALHVARVMAAALPS
jgi:FAD/FMN-containing dehydrogenase/Fe-S oxidoreductase